MKKSIATLALAVLLGFSLVSAANEMDHVTIERYGEPTGVGSIKPPTNL